jgi:hypothetical protein
MSAAERLRAHRRRLAAGRIVVPVEIDDVSTAESLILHGFLAREDQDDRAAIGRAIGALLAALVEMEGPQ